MDHDEPVRITFRMPRDVHDRLLKAAADSGRSMNAEIVERLKWTFTAGIPVWDFLEAVSGMAQEAKRLDIPFKVLIDVSDDDSKPKREL